MKSTFAKFPGIAVICLFLTSNASALATSDTTNKNKRPLMAAVAKGKSANNVLKVANVLYPDILINAQDQSLDYVEKFSNNRHDYLVRTYNRSKKYFPKVIAILKKHNIPAEFAVLMALESGFNGNAVSSAGAVGYWQIMDEVAKEYGLRIAQKEIALTKKEQAALKAKGKKATKIKKQTDDRKDFTKSTYAAAKYLRDRHRNLNGDWLLITASYNCGVGNVWNAMEKCGKATPTFWDIKNYLPAETRAYVMNFIALNVIFNNYDKFISNDLCFKDIIAKKENIND